MSFTAPVFTNAGIQLQLRALSGDPLTFTKIGIGDGEISGAIAAMTALSNQIIAVDISMAKRTDKTFTVGGTFTNVGLDGFWWREVGLFAANPDYPDDRSKDILYCYQNAFTLAEYIASGSSTVIEKMIRISAAVGNAENVTAVIDSSTVYLTMDDLESVLEDYATTTQLTEGLSGKAPKNHTHASSDITGLAVVATSGKYSDLSGKPTSLPANGGNANTVNGHTVESDVPENAVFTDTTYDAATESVSGLVTTTTQNFAGNKFVQAERVGVRMMGVTKGTAPTSTQLAHIQFQDGSGANADSASVGQIFHQIAKDTGESRLTIQANDAMTAGSKTGTTLSVVNNNGEGYAEVSAPSSPARYCLRNMASGTAAARDANCPSGAWYGKHK